MVSLFRSSTCAQVSKLRVRVLDPNDKPVANADVEVFDYAYGSLNKTDGRGSTDSKGELILEDWKTIGYCYLAIRHPDFAPSLEMVPPADGDETQVDFKLAPAANAYLQIQTPDGKPLGGAEVTRMEYNSKLTGSKHFATHDFFKSLMGNNGTAYQSDAEGKLRLPPLPQDAELKVTVAHPNWAVGETGNLKLGELRQTTLTVAKGTTVEAYLNGSPEVLDKLEGQSIEVRTSDRDKNLLMHRFFVSGARFEFTLVPGRYDSFQIRAGEDVVITPRLPSSSMLAEFARIPDEGRVRKNFVVRDLHSISGRVVDSNQKPVGNLGVYLTYENLYVDENGDHRVVAEHPTTGTIIQTDENGEFTVKAPKGKTNLCAWWTGGYYSIPEEMEFEVEGDAKIADYIVRPMPTLKGMIVDEQGNAFPHAVLRFLDSNSESKYRFADAEGRFSIDATTFDYDGETETRSNFKQLMAFDLASTRCCIERIDVTDTNAIADVRLTLNPQSAGYLMEAITRRNEVEFERMVEKSNYIKEEIEKQKAANATAENDVTQAPDLDKGIWIDGTARSLADLRGKYVLLDFWFIGCGPCEREIPNLKAVHKAFKDRGFTVIGVHNAGQSVNAVKQYMEDKQIEYPMVIDAFDEPIKKAYEPLGLRGYPTYFLIDPEGKIDKKSHVRGYKLEAIREKILLMEQKPE
jgi:peroxiredoxin